MEEYKLWDKLPPKPENLKNIKTDLENGIAPNFPFFIVGMNDIKAKISEDVSHIDGASMRFLYLQASYGNGKSNLMKYIKYYFDFVGGVKVNYWRVDVNQYDLVLFLLSIIEQNNVEDLKSGIRRLANGENDHIGDLANKYQDSFAAIKEYVEKLISIAKDNQSSDKNLELLISLGSGKVTNKNTFSKMGITPLTDYNRREILVFFLNVLSYAGVHIIFEIDELEKIMDKSPYRFTLFLTSFREILDLASLIRGHYLIVASTLAAGRGANKSLDELNPAFYRRIKTNQLVQIDAISDGNDKEQLVDFLAELLDISDAPKINKLKSNVKSNVFSSTSDIVVYICNGLLDKLIGDWEEKLKKSALTDSFNRVYADIENESGFEQIGTKFFSILELFIKSRFYDDSNYDVKIQRHQCLINNRDKRMQVFFFADDKEKSIARLENLRSLYPNFSIVVYRPSKLEISKADFPAEDYVVYDPKKLMTLFQMYLDYSYDEGHRVALEKSISIYTDQNL